MWAYCVARPRIIPSNDRPLRSLLEGLAGVSSRGLPPHAGYCRVQRDAIWSAEPQSQPDDHHAENTTLIAWMLTKVN